MDELNGQQRHWDRAFSAMPGLFGDEPGEPGRIAADLFKREGVRRVLELGGGEGRDALYFAHGGFQVDVLDYSETAVRALTEKAARLGLSDRVTARQHDVRGNLPFGNETFDACYSHMLFCMALTSAELVRLSREVLRVLRPQGLHVYTVRHTGDPHYGRGVSRGDDLYEFDGFIVHFFSLEKIGELAEGYELLSVDEFEEGDLPRKLFRVTMRKHQ